MRDLLCQHAHARRSGGREPAVVRESRLRGHLRDCSRDCRPACWGTPLQLRCPQPRGAYAPRLLFARRSSADGIATFPMHKHTPTKSGGREPAVCRANALAKALPQMLGRPPGGVLAHAVAITVAKPRGAYASRSWLYTRLCIAKVAFSLSSERRAPGAAGVSPLWRGKGVGETDSVNLQGTKTRRKHKELLSASSCLRV